MNPRILKDNAEKIITNYTEESVKFNEKEKVKSKIKKLKLGGKIRRGMENTSYI